MSPWVYVIMAFMFLIVSGSVYVITKILLSMLFKEIKSRKHNDMFEKIYKETMKEL